MVRDEKKSRRNGSRIRGEFNSAVYDLSIAKQEIQSLKEQVFAKAFEEQIIGVTKE